MSTFKLSQDQVNFYRDNGYLVVKNLVDHNSLEIYRQRFKQISDGTIKFDHAIFGVVKNSKGNGEQVINKVQDIQNDDVFYTYISHPRVLSVVHQLIGDKVNALHSMFINKPPGTGRHPPHQDIFYFTIRPYDKILGMWTAVDEVTRDNGAMYVLPGSHKPVIIFPHEQKMNDSKLFHSIADEATLAPEDKRVHLDDMHPGDTLLIHPLLIHGSKPNVSKSYRKAISCHYHNNDCYYIDPAGTPHEKMTKQVLRVINKRGFLGITYEDMLRIKTVPITATKSNL